MDKMAVEDVEPVSQAGFEEGFRRAYNPRVRIVLDSPFFRPKVVDPDVPLLVQTDSIRCHPGGRIARSDDALFSAFFISGGLEYVNETARMPVPDKDAALKVIDSNFAHLRKIEEMLENPNVIMTGDVVQEVTSWINDAQPEECIDYLRGGKSQLSESNLGKMEGVRHDKAKQELTLANMGYLLTLKQTLEYYLGEGRVLCLGRDNFGMAARLADLAKIPVTDAGNVIAAYREAFEGNCVEIWSDDRHIQRALFNIHRLNPHDRFEIYPNVLDALIGIRKGYYDQYMANWHSDGTSSTKLAVRSRFDKVHYRDRHRWSVPCGNSK